MVESLRSGKRGRAPLAYFGAALILAAVAIVSRHYQIIALYALALGVLGGCALWLLFRAAERTGRQSRQVIADRFKSALLEPSSSPKIAGAHWTIVDGAFYRVSHDAGPRGMLYDGSTSWEFRHSDELAEQKKRRLAALVCICVFGFIAASAFAGSLRIQTGLPSTGSPEDIESYTLWAAIALVVSLWFIGREYLYRFGYQKMKGAMVLDPEPIRAERELVESQKAHGAADTAEQARVLAAASGDTRRSKVHDQKF